MALIAILSGITLTGVLTGAGVSLLAQAVASTTGSIVGMVRRVTSTDQPGMQEVIKELNKIDLEFSVEVLSELVKEIEAHDELEQESIKKALIGVQTILENIEKEMQTIQDSMELHNQKYMNSWRVFECDCNLETLRVNKKLLEQRCGMLVNLLKIYLGR